MIIYEIQSAIVYKDLPKLFLVSDDNTVKIKHTDIKYTIMKHFATSLDKNKPGKGI